MDDVLHLCMIFISGPGVSMHKLLFITAFITALTLGSESFRVPRLAEEKETGTVDTVIETLKSYYDHSMETISGYMENIKGFQLDEKESVTIETTTAARTYAGIFQDQLYHMVYPQDA
uniref:Apolipoprotein C-II n=1 Tax=Electrophorus electricus TaxID=8005 RepID=A0A4W4FYZ0_ELEEL